MNSLDFGHGAEDKAAHYLNACGYHIIANNWRQGREELDLIATKEQQLIFVEVKAGSERNDPFLHFTRKKQWQLSKAMNAYLEQGDLWASDFRADLITIRFDKHGQVIALDHYEDII